eukprot:449142_1
MVCDSHAYRVVIHKTFEGNLSTKPVNGAICIFNPCNGMLYLKIIHKSIWNISRRLSQLAKERTACEILSLIQSLPKEQHPKQIICIRKGIIEHLEKTLSKYWNIIIRGCDLSLSFHSFMNIQMLNDLVSKAIESRMCLFNLYDDWLQTISMYNAFSRLMLIFKCLSVNQDKTKAILNQCSIKKSYHIWPSFVFNEWIEIEKQLQKLLFVNYQPLIVG